MFGIFSHFLLAIFAHQNYVVVEQLGAEDTSLGSGRLIFCFQLLKDAELLRC